MVNKDLENKIKQLKDFIDLWAIFYGIYKKASEKDSFSDEEERDFLELKSGLARKYQALMDTLGIKPTAEDRTFDVISQVMSLKSVSNLSPLQAEKLENDWHNSYITLNKILGSLENKREELGRVSAFGEFMKKLFGNPFFALLLIIMLIYFIYYIMTIIK